ncbi:MAG: aminotransferase class V-fold PLP-dependent enzyme [Candidatus Eremiobacteraeota bacterium]|nr:aminotransferase class V-fold PLP-dependent enzyme [Candidatus Eremiobacteraeota bacterium]
MNDDFRTNAGRVADWIDAYYSDNRRYPVLAQTQPGELVAALPAEAPEEGEPFEEIFADFERLIVPGITHWNHPRFFAYFAISAAPVTVLAEMLAATLDVNAMLWRTSPAATELEDVVTAWLRRLFGLPGYLHGIIYDTASIAGFTALGAAREALNLGIRERGLVGRKDLPKLRVYITEHTHSHIEKAAIALGIGRENVVKVACDDRFAMRPEALDEAIRRDLAQKMRPMAICATVGTTATTSIDPVPKIAQIARANQVWLHVDAAYAGPAAIIPEMRWLMAGVEHADSLVLNPHKWLFVPVDLSVLYVRDPEILRRAFSLASDILATSETGVRNYMDYGLQLGRRFRALKLWFLLRHYGARKVRGVLRGHIELAQQLAAWIEAEPGWEVVAPHPLSVVCFRYVHRGDGESEEDIDARNARLADEVNATGEAFLGATRIDGKTALRIAIGNERTTREDVAHAWELLRTFAARQPAAVG